MSNYEKFALFLGGATFAGALLYWTGRWYKQSYFERFKIPYESIGFDHYYYIYHSWCTVLVAVAIIGILLFSLITYSSLVRAFLETNELKHKMASIVFSFLSTATIILCILLIMKKGEHLLSGYIVGKLFDSKDIVIILAGILSFVLCTIFLLITRFDIAAHLPKIFQKTEPYGIPIAISTCLLIWLHFAATGYILGHYHADSAIRRTKMQIPHVKLLNAKNGECWLYIAKASDNRSYIFEPDSLKAACVSDDQIIEIK